MERSIEYACLDQARFDPESVVTLVALQAISRLHFLYPRPQVLATGALNKPVKGGNPLRSPDENLNAAGITDDVRFGLLRLFDRARRGANRAGKHFVSA